MTQQTEPTPASGNPWYVLMTVAGEQTGGNFDEELHALGLPLNFHPA